MRNGRYGGRPSFPGGRVPNRFDVRRVVLPPGDARAFVEAEWRDALVLVGQGEIEVVCRQGSCCRFGSGSVLWLTGMSVRELRCRGREAAELIVVSRLVRTE